jgi:AcrR family transcriptional regulator
MLSNNISGVKMARKTKEDAEETRDSILEAATRVFIENGFSNASLEQIAVKAGVTRGAIYWHFKNKMDIFQALHDQLYTPFSEMIVKDLEEDNNMPLKQLEELCIKLFIDLEKIPQRKRILTIFFLKCDYSGQMQKLLECQNMRKKDSMNLFAKYFERAKEKGHIAKDADSYILTVSLVCYITGIAYEFLRNPTMIEIEKEIPKLISLFFIGINNSRINQSI